MSVNLWTLTEHALDYLSRADSIPHRAEGESALLEFIPVAAQLILDLGTGDGRLLALVKQDHPSATAVAIGFSPAMLQAAKSVSTKMLLSPSWRTIWKLLFRH